jgi:hypothetical protein
MHPRSEAEGDGLRLARPRLDGSAVHPLSGDGRATPVRQRRPHNLLVSHIGQAASEIAEAKTGTLKGGASPLIAQGLRKAVEGRLAGNPGRTGTKPIQCACGALLIETPHPASTSQTRANRVRISPAHLMGRYGAQPRSKG